VDSVVQAPVEHESEDKSLRLVPWVWRGTAVHVAPRRRGSPDYQPERGSSCKELTATDGSIPSGMAWIDSLRTLIAGPVHSLRLGTALTIRGRGGGPLSRAGERASSDWAAPRSPFHPEDLMRDPRSAPLSSSPFGCAWARVARASFPER
jgi:hypothetical protein